MTFEVPHLSCAAIERDAEGLLLECALARGVALGAPIPIEEIAERHLDLRIDFDDLREVFCMPRRWAERQYLGALVVHQSPGREEFGILVDQSLDPDEHPEAEAQFRLTLAHEIGHWRLHSRHPVDTPALRSQIGQHAGPVAVRQSTTAVPRAEWQVDHYALCLLMPRPLVLETWRREHPPHLPLDCLARGSIEEMDRLVSGTPWSVRKVFCHPLRPLDGIAKHFAPIFGVPVEAMEARLLQLGLLYRWGSLFALLESRVPPHFAEHADAAAKAGVSSLGRLATAALSSCKSLGLNRPVSTLAGGSAGVPLATFSAVADCVKAMPHDA